MIPNLALITNKQNEELNLTMRRLDTFSELKTHPIDYSWHIASPSDLFIVCPSEAVMHPKRNVSLVSSLPKK
jgi:hypothetical protein